MTLKKRSANLPKSTTLISLAVTNQNSRSLMKPTKYFLMNVSEPSTTPTVIRSIKVVVFPPRVVELEAGTSLVFPPAMDSQLTLMIFLATFLVDGEEAKRSVDETYLSISSFRL